MNNNVHCVIMAGGVGSRFWPMSRQNMPKQYLDILGTGSSLIKLTYDRFKHITPTENFMVVTSSNYSKLTHDHLPNLKTNQVLLEPQRKNTAPCIAYAAFKLFEKDPDSIMVITPADHIILKEHAFHASINEAIEHASTTGNLVTLGIQPTRPDSGYGYIQFHREGNYSAESIKKVKTFTEKPSTDLAIKFLQSGDFYWNSGMFIWKTSAIIDAIKKYLPDMAEAFETCKEDYWSNEETQSINRIYSECQSISIDYGIMEKADNVDVVLGQDFGWSDLGTWGSLYDQVKSASGANVNFGDNVRSYDTNSTIVMMPKDKLAVIQGLDNYIVVDTEDALLICQKDEEQKIKQFVKDLENNGKSSFL
jgi:mannose-1-phosphate guanylyltransferase